MAWVGSSHSGWAVGGLAVGAVGGQQQHLRIILCYNGYNAYNGYNELFLIVAIVGIVM
jgi:hypothetical protein